MDRLKTMEIIRKTQTMCPECGVELPGEVIVDDGAAWLARECPRHGTFRFLLSRNGQEYADLDRFYFDVLGSDEPYGRVTNYWVLITGECQINCGYCQTEINRPFYDEMTEAGLTRIVEKYGRGRAKLTLSGGEPTLHPGLLELLRAARRGGAAPQLATNGVALASGEYVRALVDAGAREIRISVDSLRSAEMEPIGTAEFFSAKSDALKNLERLRAATVLAPTIFKGINESQSAETLEYAARTISVKGLSTNGFSWVGEGTRMAREMMMMPDEMMDLMHERFFKGPREDVFTFQKFMFAALRLLGVRVCFYTQTMFFVRTPSGPAPISEFLDMRRLAAALKWWERFARRPQAARGAAFAAVCAAAFRPASLKIAAPILRMILANSSGMAIERWPSALIPMVLNTNCSTLSMDETLGRQCMSRILYMKGGEIREEPTTRKLIERELEKIRAK